MAITTRPQPTICPIPVYLRDFHDLALCPLPSQSGTKTSDPTATDRDGRLAAGFPIATGVIEGACRYLVKDRMDISDARWTVAGAEAVLLRLRALRASGNFEEYWAFHEARHHPVYPSQWSCRTAKTLLLATSHDCMLCREEGGPTSRAWACGAAPAQCTAL